jgi:hypothetical protein
MMFNNKKPRKTFIAVFILAAIFVMAAPCSAEVRNLTEENRKAVAGKVLELRQSELMRRTRGRIKANPIPLSFFTSYQTVMMDQDFMLARLLDDYRGALIEMERAKKDFGNFVSSTTGESVARLFDDALIEAYSLKPRIEKAESIWNIWYEFLVSRYRLQALPVQMRIALNAGAWMSRISPGGQIPKQELEDYIALCNTKLSPGDIFEADRMLDELSVKFSRLYLELAKVREGGGR